MTRTNAGWRVVPKTIFPVSDIDEAASFYRSLGFEVERHDGGYAWVSHQGDEILHLALVPDLARDTNRSACYFHVQDAVDWHTRWSGSGVDVGLIEDHPWQMREFSLRDPSGNLLRVGQNL